ncbi:hypothetical protein Pcinc_011632 [Petrolisthes cinctipes]|uniref:Potassium channel domain-containing protein n=1 Tax=Petrolisthes cinctipes TaxID=88211 RepID=A0AAE1G2A2_PETCI|nr:hypothetical protein Pcinc_011632 [Petrolisthes cinctipes]
MLAGAFIFVALEVNNELNELDELYLLKQHVIDVVYGLDNSSQPEVEEVIREVGEECGHDFLSIEQDGPLTWSLWNSFFFSFTVITTIGFGHMAPKTPYGRVVCILYATLGVPLNGILIAALADIFSAKLIIWDVKRWAERYRNSVQVAVDAVLYLVPGLLIFLVVPSFVIMMVEEGWSYLDCFYYAFITLTTIGFGDHVAGRQEKDQLWLWMYKIISVVWIIFGLGYIIMVITFIQKALKNRHIRNVERKMTKILKKHVGKLSQNIRGDLRKVRKVVKGGNPQVYPENKENFKDEPCQTPTTSTQQQPPPALKDCGTPYRRYRSASESDVVKVEKELYSGWSLDQVLELVERLLCEEELRASRNLQAHIIQQLHRGFYNRKDNGDLEGDLEIGEDDEESSRDLQTYKTGRFSRLMERIGNSKVLDINHRKHSTFSLGKPRGKIMFDQDRQTNGKDREGKIMAIGYLNHCYQDDEGNHSHAYQPSPKLSTGHHNNHEYSSNDNLNHENNPSNNHNHENNPSNNQNNENNSSNNHNNENNPSNNHNNENNPSNNHNNENNPSNNHNNENNPSNYHNNENNPSNNHNNENNPSNNHNHENNPSNNHNNENNPSNNHSHENNPSNNQNPNDNLNQEQQKNHSDSHDKNIERQISPNQDRNSHQSTTSRSQEFTKF